MSHIRVGIDRELASGVDQRVLRWFGHVGRTDENRNAKSVLTTEASGWEVRFIPMLD